MREIIIEYSTSHDEDPETDSTRGAESTIIRRKTGNNDGTYPTRAGDLQVTRQEKPPGILLKGNPVGGEVFVSISHNPRETDAHKRYGGEAELGEPGTGTVTVYAPEFRGTVPVQNGKLIPNAR